MCHSLAIMSAAAEGRPGESHIPTDELLALSLASVTSQTDPSTDIPLLRKLAADGLVIAHKASINPETARFLNINLDVLVPSVNQFRVGFNSHVLAEAGAEQASVQRARRMVKGCNTFSAVMLNCDAVNGVLKAMGPETLAYHLDYVTSLYKNEVQLQGFLDICDNTMPFRYYWMTKIAFGLRQLVLFRLVLRMAYIQVYLRTNKMKVEISASAITRLLLPLHDIPGHYQTKLHMIEPILTRGLP